MTIETLNQIEQNPQISVQQASEMFGILFEDPRNRDAAKSLFDWLLWAVREQKVQETIRMAKWWLEDLKNTIA